MIATIARLTARLNQDPDLDDPLTDREDVRDFAHALASAEIDDLIKDVDDSEARFAKLADLAGSYDEPLEEAYALRDAAIRVLIARPAIGGEGVKRADVPALLRITHTDVYQAGKLSQRADVEAARGNLIGPDAELLTPHDAAVYAQACILWFTALREAAGAKRMSILKALASGDYSTEGGPIARLRHELSKPPSANDALEAKELQALAAELAEPEIDRLVDVDDPEERLTRLTAIIDTYTELVTIAGALRSRAVKILITPQEEGGEGRKKAPTAAQLRLTRGFLYKKLPDTQWKTNETIAQARRSLRGPNGKVMTPLDAALYAQANVVWWKALYEIATKQRITLVKEMAAGLHGRPYEPHRIAEIGDLDSALVTYMVNWSGEGARQERIRAAAALPLPPAARAALISAERPGYVLSTRGDQAVRRNTLTGLVNQELAVWVDDPDAEPDERPYEVALNANGQQERAKLRDKAAKLLANAAPPNYRLAEYGDEDPIASRSALEWLVEHRLAAWLHDEGKTAYRVELTDVGRAVHAEAFEQAA